MRTVFRTAEVNAAFGTATVRQRVRRGEWRRPEVGVVVTHNGELSRQEQQEVVLCLCPPASVLAGLTALEHDRFSVLDERHTWIVLPEGARRPDHDAAFHWSTKLDDEDVHPAREPRRTRPARSVIDAASWAPSDRAARLYVIAAVQQGLVSARTVREALTRRGPCHRRALIVESILDAAGGIQSLPERDFDDIRRSLLLPTPSRQVRVKGQDGRYYLDASWDEWATAVEVHGIGHLQARRWSADLTRSNELVIGGRRLLAFSSFSIRHEKDAVADQLRRLFLAVGRTDADASRPDTGHRASTSVHL